MQLAINPNAVAAFDKEAEALIQFVVSKPPVTPPPPGGYTPGFHAVEIAAEDMGGLVLSETDVDDVPLSQFVEMNGEQVGIEGDGYKTLLILAEKIHRRAEINPFVSAKGIQDVLLKWAVARRLEQVAEQMSLYCFPKLEGTIKDLFLWVPIFGMATPFSFDLGRTTVYPMSKQFFDTWEATFSKHPKLDRAKYQPAIDDYRRRLQGWAACTMNIRAEPRRAYEVVMEEAENALAILRVFLPTILHPSATSYCRPVGKEGLEHELIFSIHGDLPPSWTEGADSFRPWILDEDLMATLAESGLGTLHNLYLLDKKSEFQTALLKSIMIYSRSSLKQEAADRIIYVFTALDSFLLQNQSENIQQNIAERIAFTVSGDAQDRLRIKKNIIAAYGMRSQAVHHNQGVQDRETVIEFLGNVFRFYLLMIGKNKVYNTRQDFFNEVDLKKFS